MAFAACLVVAPFAGAEPSAIAHQEIDYLLGFIGNSNCEFKRNGAWNSAQAAESHVRGKYDVLRKFGMIDTTNDFIDKAATQSYFSGIPYEIKCGAGSPMSSKLWLSNELARIRAVQERPQDKSGTQ